MIKIEGNNPAKHSDISAFLGAIDFLFPKDLIDFYSMNNGVEIKSDDAYVILWPITELLNLNSLYQVGLYAQDFFLIGSDGGDTAFVVEKKSGKIFDMPFIGMSKDETILRGNNLKEFLDAL